MTITLDSPSDDLMSHKIGFKELLPGKFEINTDQSKKRWIWIKLAELPGVQIKDEQGNLVPHFQAFPGIIAYGQGTLILTYTTPKVYFIGYLITIITLFAVILLRRRCKIDRPIGHL